MQSEESERRRVCTQETNFMANVLSGIIRAEEDHSSDSSDYRNAEGLLMCGKCHTAKQIKVPAPTDLYKSGEMTVNVLCKCKAKEQMELKAHQQELRYSQKITELMKAGISDPLYYKFTFENDDGQNEKISAICRKYVQMWEKMKSNNIGVIFQGDIGTGKTFFALCIANALLKNLVPVYVTNLTTVLNKLQDFSEDRKTLVEQMKSCDLLVIDDFGSQRNTNFSLEQVFNVMDTRMRSNKPLIVTTNLSECQLKNSTSLQEKRIFDRMLELCPIKLQMKGDSRRVGNAQKKLTIARELFKYNE